MESFQLIPPSAQGARKRMLTNGCRAMAHRGDDRSHRFVRAWSNSRFRFTNFGFSAGGRAFAAAERDSEKRVAVGCQ
jgi:hypothetical protein